MKRGWAALLAFAAAWAAAADVSETLTAGYKAFLEGRLEDAASAYRYVAALGVGGYESDANLALIARDSADGESALALWVKATLQEGADGFSWDQRGWAYLAEGRPKEAREAFLKAIDRSSTTAAQAEANLGLGLAALARSEPKNGMAPLRSALVQGPYLMPAASYETALTALALGDKQAALAYLRQGLDLDPLHMESLRELARLYERIGENRAAWRAFSRIAALDPRDHEAPGKVKRLSQYISGDPETSMAIRRLTRPLLNPESGDVGEGSASSGTLRVALFCDFEGKPATLSHVYFIVNTPFRIVAANGDVVKEDGRAFDQWEIVYRSENNLIEVRDASRNIQYTSKTPFRIVPAARMGSVLLKSARFSDNVSSNFDRGDRELRGQIDAMPTPSGFKIVNEVKVEDYLYGAVGAALPQGSPVEAYKAQAIVSRTLALWHRAQGRPNMERSDICDSRKCQRYIGVNEEMRDASKGVTATEGLVLTRGGRLERAMQHEHCGGRTEDGAATGEASLAGLVSSSDGPGPAAPASPLQLERQLHEYPAREKYCEASALTPQSESRWMRLLDGKTLQARADRDHSVGAIQHIRAKRRTATGRVRALEVVGSRGKFELEGDQAIGDFLSPGSLRSALFTIQPLKRASGPARWLLWGAGTGHGLGMCRAGAIGQAALGRGYKDILAVYFPGALVDSLIPASRASKSESQPAAGKRKALNPRFKK